MTSESPRGQYADRSAVSSSSSDDDDERAAFSASQLCIVFHFATQPLTLLHAITRFLANFHIRYVDSLSSAICCFSIAKCLKIRFDQDGLFSSPWITINTSIFEN